MLRFFCYWLKLLTFDLIRRSAKLEGEGALLCLSQSVTEVTAQTTLKNKCLNAGTGYCLVQKKIHFMEKNTGTPGFRI